MYFVPASWGRIWKFPMNKNISGGTHSQALGPIRIIARAVYDFKYFQGLPFGLFEFEEKCSPI